MKSGFVGIIGRANVGKSSLLNSILERKIAIVSNKSQTTRNTIQGIYHEDDTQIVFVDTPGIHKPTHKMGRELNRQAYYSIDDVDVIMFVVDGSTNLGGGDKYVLEKLKDVTKPVILVINQIDKLNKEQIFNKINEYKDLYPFSDIVPVSALKHKNIDTLIKVLKTYLKDNIKYYGDNDITNKSIEFMMSELIREKVFNLTEQEVPHSVACVIESVEIGKTSNTINASIIVDRDSLKKIIIGANGSKIKEIGTLARKDIEELINKKVYLDLVVKTVKKWRDREKYLDEFGIIEKE